MLNEYINDNSISSIAAGFFLAISSGIAYMVVGMHRTRTEARQAKELAATAVTNTEPVSNGFTRGIKQQLETLIHEVKQQRFAIDNQNKLLQEHLQWHLTEGNDK